MSSLATALLTEGGGSGERLTAEGGSGGPPPSLRVYRIRWWLLALTSAFAAVQGGVWLLYGVCAEAVAPLYSGWDDATIGWISFWGPSAYVLAFWPSCYLLDVAGLRPALLSGIGAVFAGAVARSVEPRPGAVGAALVHTGQVRTVQLVAHPPAHPPTASPLRRF